MIKCAMLYDECVLISDIHVQISGGRIVQDITLGA